VPSLRAVPRQRVAVPAVREEGVMTIPPCCRRCHVILSEPPRCPCKVCGACIRTGCAVAEGSGCDCVAGIVTIVNAGKGTITVECAERPVEVPPSVGIRFELRPALVLSEDD
jgi:hypothetical protein